MHAKIVLLPGDGIGPEVVGEGRRLLEHVARRGGHAFELEARLVGGAAIDATGNPLPEETLAACRGSSAVLLGAVGGPKWDDPRAKVRPEQGLLGLRRGLEVYANLRPVRPTPSLADRSPLAGNRLEGIDLVVVRELTGGLYFGPRRRETVDGHVRAVDTLEYTDTEIRRVLRVGFELARKRATPKRPPKVTSVDKANVLESSRLWRELAIAVARDFPDVALEHQLVDSCAMRLVTHPQTFDVIVTENLFGDILSDEAAVLVGSLGLLPSASIGDAGPGLYEPIHGSAPDIAGQGIANPVGTLLSVAMLLRHSLGLGDEATQIERAVEDAFGAGLRTPDLGGSVTTREMTDAVLARL